MKYFLKEISNNMKKATLFLFLLITTTASFAQQKHTFEIKSIQVKCTLQECQEPIGNNDCK
jgi:hypothetical protein